MIRNVLHLTQDGLNKIKNELVNRKTEVRREIADRIDEARRLGDLSENSAYKAALEDRTVNEKRISDLEEMVARAQIIQKGASDIVSLGSEVRVDMGGREVVYQIVGATEADPVKLAISNESPIGAALMGKKSGDEVSVDLPAGTRVFKIVGVK